MKEFARRAARLLSKLAAIPFLSCYCLASIAFGKDSALEGASQLISLVPGKVGNAVRAAFYSTVLKDCSPTVTICFGTLLSKVGASIGANVYIGPYCQLGLVTIGRDTLLGPSVQIPSGGKTHSFERLDIPIRNQGNESVRVEIGEDCWIGAGSIVMANVGSQTVVGAGSVVTKPLESRIVAAGVPAKPLKPRT